MAMSFSRPDPSSPNAVSTAAFTTSRKGYEQGEVRDFLRMVAAELARLQERERFLDRELRTAQRGTTNANVALDEEVVTRLLGEEAARILSTAREAASSIKVRAEDNAARILREATDEAQRMREEAQVEAARRRQDASADAEAELQMAKQQGRDMVNEARAYRERVLNELARRREMARQQIEQLVHGRDRLLQSFERARIAAVDVMAEMTPLGEPNEYVNLEPTTGPVPLMVPAAQLRLVDGASDADSSSSEDPAVDEIVDDMAAETELEVADEPEAEDTLDEVADEVADDLVDESATEEAATEEAAVEEAAVEVAPELDIQPAVDAADEPESDVIAPVVSLFGGTTVTSEAVDAAPAAAPEKDSVEDLFAKLRASRTAKVAERAVAAESSEVAVEQPVMEAAPEIVLPDATEELAVFRSTPEAPVAPAEFDDSAFGRRDAELTPLIVGSARKLKRVLADEQNDVLHVLRSAKKINALSDLLPSEAEHVRHYADAIDAELRAAALAGAVSLGDGTAKEHKKAVAKAEVLQPAVAALGTSIVQPLRDRLERAVSDTDGEPDDLVAVVRAVYREWKTQRIDEHLDDVARMAFGRGQLAVLVPGTPICWAVDPNGPDCPDAEDNALGGVVKAGDPFPTDHVCTPAHEGCRCMLQRAPR